MIFLVYIKLEDNKDKFMQKYQNMPRTIQKILFRAKCKKGKFEIQKINDLECIVLPEINDRVLKRLKMFSNIRCWKNVCLSENLRQDAQFMHFVKDNFWNVMDGKWLFKNRLDEILEYAVEVRGGMMGNQEVSILCHHLDETIAEKIKEICVKVKVCNILTTQTKQFQKLEDEIYQTNGIVINVSKNYKKALAKSSVVLNLDFHCRDLAKCVWAKQVDIIQMKDSVLLEKKDFLGKNIVAFGIDMPEKYKEYAEKLDGFNACILYESFIYKRTSYRNIKKELLEDDARILYLQDSNHKIMKKPNLILPKALDKIMI